MNTVDRVISIVSYMAEKAKPLTLADISGKLRINKSGTYRILSFLEVAGWIIQQPDTGWYSLGPRIVAFSTNVISNLTVRSISSPYMEELLDSIGETVVLNMRVGYERLIVDLLTPSHDLLYYAPLGRRTPLWVGSHGKTILAFLPDYEIEIGMEKLRKLEYKAYASGEVINIDILRQKLAEIRKDGFAVSLGESVKGVIGIAAPIFGRGQEVIGSLAIAAPSVRLTEDTARQHGLLIKHSANEISMRLGNFYWHK